MKTKDRAMRVFKLQSAESNNDAEIYTVTIPMTKATVFQIVRCYVACGATFRMKNNLIGAAYYVLVNPSMWAHGDHLVVSYVAVHRARNFQRISDLLQRLWTFSADLDGATHQGTSDLDLRARIYDSFIIHNFHIYALPMFELNTGKVILNTVKIQLSIICPDWKENILSVLTDYARNMTRQYQGVVNHLDNSLMNTLVRVWCGAHQIDLVIGEILL